MSSKFRQIALLLIFVFLANIQAWALTLEDGTHHSKNLNSQLISLEYDVQQHQSNKCEEAGGHCCHAINHLLGQVSNRLLINNFSKYANFFLVVELSATSTDPEDLYRPPRTPSLT